MSTADATPPRGDAMPPGGAGMVSSEAAERARRVEAVLQRVEQLPTLSPIAARLLALSSREDADFEQIVRLIEADPVLTGKILALCRRASSGVSSAVTTVRRAAVLLGLEAVQAAVLSLQVFDVLGRPPAAEEAGAVEGGRAFDRDGFWRHSVAVACAAELLAEQHKPLMIRPDEAFTAGLVHDLGKLALAWVLPQAYARVLGLAEARGSDLAGLERSVLGLDHHVAGKRLAEHWSLPNLLQDAMWLHGQPAHALPEVKHKAVIGVVTVADALARRLLLGWSGSCGAVASVEEVCRQAGLRPEAVRAIEPRLHEALASRCADLGLGQATAAELVLDSIATANARLGRMNQTLAERAQQARQMGRALDVVGRMATGPAARGGAGELLREVVRGLIDACGAGFYAGIVPARGGAAWTLVTFGAGGVVARAETLEPPTDELGQAMALPGTSGPGLGDSLGLAAWLGRHAAVEVRGLRVLPLVSERGTEAVLVHDRAGLDEALGGKGRAVVERLGGWAAAAAGQVEGSRRLSEALAETTRVLNETQGKLAEAQAMARLGELTAGAAHELNNPLTVLSGKAQGLAGRLSGRDGDDARAIVAAAGRLTDLVSALHFLAVPPALKPTVVGLDQLARDAIRQGQEWARRGEGRVGEGRAVAVQVRVEGTLGDVRVDAALLTRALAELVRNALEGPADSRVELCVGRDGATGGVRVRVEDDGPGFSAHALAHAFDPFFSEKPAGRQTGLGLPTARRLVELHGGSLTVLNAPSGGGVAEIVLPASTWSSAAGSVAA